MSKQVSIIVAASCVLEFNYFYDLLNFDGHAHVNVHQEGGRVMPDWPGLHDSKLYEARDLKPTICLRSVQ